MVDYSRFDKICLRDDEEDKSEKAGELVDSLLDCGFSPKNEYIFVVITLSTLNQSF